MKRMRYKTINIVLLRQPADLFSILRYLVVNERAVQQLLSFLSYTRKKQRPFLLLNYITCVNTLQKKMWITCE